jgi:CRP-like cAMP-binding protein
MRAGRKPTIRRVRRGADVVAQGAPGDDLFLLLDGVLAVIVDGEKVGELGPGAIAGERAVLEGGVRTATLRAVTDVRVAVAAGADIDRDALARLAEGHRREEA